MQNRDSGNALWWDVSLVPFAEQFSTAGGAYYLALRARGMSTTAAFVALGRKLARVCFTLLKNDTDFNPEVRKMACPPT